MTAQVVLLVVLMIGDVALWILGTLSPMGATGRFRTFAAAAVLLAILCGSVFGWSRTAPVGALALWLAAIVISSLPSRTLRSPQAG